MQRLQTLLSAFQSLSAFGYLFGLGPRVVTNTKKTRKSNKFQPVRQDEKFDTTMMTNRHIHSKERRRTARVALAVPVIVQGRTKSDEDFSVRTFTCSVDAHGGSIALDVLVVIGETLALVNENGNERAECKIVSVRTGRDNKKYVGFEFTAPDCNFWHMTFTVPGAKPLRRVLPIRMTA